MTPARERWTFTIEVLPGDTPGAIRVRRALKYLLRGLGLRCTAVLDAPPDEPPSGPSAAAAGVVPGANGAIHGAKP